MLQQRIPRKLKDPGRFTIPCSIGQFHFSKTLCDLGASIKLMLLYVYNKLGIKTMRNTSIVLQFIDRLIKKPTGILEDILVRVDMFIFPTDFVILDMEDKEQEIPIILGQLFLATRRTLIDMQKGELVFRFQNDQITSA